MPAMQMRISLTYVDYLQSVGYCNIHKVEKVFSRFLSLLQSPPYLRVSLP